MTDIITSEAVAALIQVIMIDLVLAADNAVVIGLAASGLPAEQRKGAIIIGILAATALRIVFAGVTTQLLQVLGLLFAGGILLLWVCWKMWRELRTTPGDHQVNDGLLKENAVGRSETTPSGARRKTFGQATFRIDVPGQCAGASWRGTRTSLRPCFRSSVVDCPDGPCRQSNSAITPKTPLDRLCRACNYSLRRLRNDISRKPRIDRCKRSPSAITDCHYT